MVAGHPLTLTLHVHDEFGNARIQGGDRVQVDLEGPASTVVTAATVEDFGNGVYNIQFVPDLAGQWRVVPRQVYHLPYCDHTSIRFTYDSLGIPFSLESIVQYTLLKKAIGENHLNHVHQARQPHARQRHLQMPSLLSLNLRLFRN